MAGCGVLHVAQNAPQSSRSIKAVPRPKSFNEFTLSDIGLQLEDDDDDDDEEEDEEADADAHALARAMAEVDDSDDEDDEDDSDEEDEEEAAPQVMLDCIANHSTAHCCCLLGSLAVTPYIRYSQWLVNSRLVNWHVCLLKSSFVRSSKLTPAVYGNLLHLCMSAGSGLTSFSCIAFTHQECNAS